MEVTPGTEFDQLVITGSATLDGMLNTTLVNGFTPSAGDTFEIMTFGSLYGSFASINGFAFTISYYPTDIVLTVKDRGAAVETAGVPLTWREGEAREGEAPAEPLSVLEPAEPPPATGSNNYRAEKQ